MSLIDRIAGLVSSPVFSAFGLGMRLLGPLFVLGFYVLLILHFYAYMTVVIVVLKKRLGTTFGLLWCAIGLSLLYNVVFNHSLATLIKAGSPEDLKRIEQKRKELKDREHRSGISEVKDSESGTVKYVEDDRFEHVSKEVKKLLRYRTKTITQLESNWIRRCNKCNQIKPIRTHHCSICNRCVMMMDHHCPWVNNCLGLDN